MAELDQQEDLSPKQMIRRAARSLQTMTLEEKVEIMRQSEQLGEEIKARFVDHWKRQQAPRTKS